MQAPYYQTLCAFLAFAWIGGAAAQPTEDEELAQAYGDQSTISIATGSKQALRRAPSVASVITAEDIAAMGATDLDEALETVPGIHVSHSALSYTPCMFRFTRLMFNLLLSNTVWPGTAVR